ncbi:hypothetical protein ACH4UM_23560 [Streptomyces sp. NPDC020801]|uniref:hypothetical protein n=1 Tax=unclassified Streptomyces TaxID=2593676 RepID=UPI00379DEABA
MTTFADLSRPLALLRLLSADHPQLPAPHVGVSPHHPHYLTLSVHGDLGGFEAWREALGIDPGEVRHNTQSGGTTLVLTGTATIADAHVELVGYAPNLALVVEAVA